MPTKKSAKVEAVDVNFTEKQSTLEKELAAVRAENERLKAEAAKPSVGAAIHTLKSKVRGRESFGDYISRRCEEMFEQYRTADNAGEVTMKRKLLALAGSALAGYAIASAALPIIDALIIGAWAVSGSMFLVYCVYFVGWLVAIYAAIKYAQYFGLYIATGNIDKDLAKAKDWFTGLFESKAKAKDGDAPTVAAA